MQNKSVAVVNRLPELPLVNKPKLIISKEIQSQITYLHSRVGAIEWSGELLYSVVQGNILDLDNFVLKVEGIFPLDKGNAAYTEHETTADIVDLIDMYPDYLDGNLKRGYIHTHHNMNCFFSGIDKTELHDNAPKHNYYLSLIVNFDTKYCAKIAIVADNKKEKVSAESLVFKGDDAQPVEMPLSITEEKDTKVLVLIDCKIEFEQDEEFIKKVDEICSRPVRVSTPIKPATNVVPFKPESKTNQFANKFSKDVEPEIFPNSLTTTDSQFDDVTDVDTIDRFLRKILSTKTYDLEDKKTFPELIVGIDTIDKSLLTWSVQKAYLEDVEKKYEQHFEAFFGKSDGWIVSCEIGDYVDGLVPTSTVNTYDDLYSDISNLVWSMKGIV